MNKTALMACGGLLALIFIVRHYLAVYEPSKDGAMEEIVALEEMRNYCKNNSYKCSDLVVQSRVAAMPTQICIDKNGLPECKVYTGFWEFVIKLPSGNEYLIAVLPNHSLEIFGFSSEITPLRKKN